MSARKRSQRRSRKRPLRTALAVAATIFVLGWMVRAGVGHFGPVTKAERSAAVAARSGTVELLAYNDSIHLTSEQEAIRQEALEGMQAPCCDSYSAATCCCECNLARATWGLAKHLIADEGRGAAEVERQVAAWYSEINPGGFSGDACFTNGCNRPFRDNGCGGMDRDNLVF